MPLMPIDVKDTALFKHLRIASPEYYGKALELKEAIAGWLEYIPHTFPNYTRHTINHSEEIISQISKLLFGDSVELDQRRVADRFGDVIVKACHGGRLLPLSRARLLIFAHHRSGITL